MSAAPKYTAKSLHDWLERHKHLPSFPSVLIELDAVLASEAVSVEAVVAVLQVDVSVVARIMKTVNSARYIMHEPAQTLTDAVSRLGFSATRMVALLLRFWLAKHPAPRPVLRRSQRLLVVWSQFLNRAVSVGSALANRLESRALVGFL